MDSPENSGFKEMHRTGSVGRDVDAFQSITGTRTQQADSAGGPVAIRGAQAFAHTSLGANPESTPTHASGDHEFCDAVHTGHKDGTPRLETRLAPLMGVARPPRRNSGNGKRKGKGEMSRITVGAETNLAARETLETTQGRIVARFPSFPNTLWSLAGVDVACPFHTKAAVFFVPAMHAIAADKPIKSCPYRFCGTTGFNENPHLNHVAGFPIVRWGFKARGNDHAGVIFVKDEAVQLTPPTSNCAKQ